MVKELTCIICPQGCSIKVETDENNNIKKVEGNTCKRGYEYAVSEVTNPVRTITSTIKLEDGKMVSVKTNKPVPKELIFKCMEEINKKVAKVPIKMGQILIENILNTGIDVIATKEIV